MDVRSEAKGKNFYLCQLQNKSEKHILPAFGGIRYEKLTTKMLHAFIEDKLKEGLSAKYVSDIVIVFK